LVAAFAIALAAPFALAADFEILGHIPGGQDFVIPEALSADGTVAVGYALTTADEAFRWTSATGMAGLGDLPGGGFTSNALGVSADGSVVVGWGQVGPDYFDQEAFRWTPAGMVGLGDLPGGNVESQAHAASHDGSVVVGCSFSAAGRETFRWTAAGGMVGLGDLDGGSVFSCAHDVSADGTVIVGMGITSTGGRAYRWTAATGMLSLNPVNFGHSQTAYAVSGDGLYTVGLSEDASGRRAVRWNADRTALDLGDFAGGTIDSVALDVSHDGSVVVGRGRTAAGFEAFIWTAEAGMRRLIDVLVAFGVSDLEGWTLTGAQSVSGAGDVILGSGLTPERSDVNFLARLSLPDTDRDLVPDRSDNCSGIPNPDQRDSDGDGYGNRCDADLDNSGGLVNATDLALFRLAFGTTNAHADFNGSGGSVNSMDLAIFRTLFGKPVGPSALPP
jgi:probable HAF family extracellular repeat protein